MVEGELMLVQLTEHCADVEVGVRLDFGSLQTRFDSKCLLKEIESGAHLANATVIASHVVESHCHSELISLAKFF